jgi:hypothetical protein
MISTVSHLLEWSQNGTFGGSCYEECYEGRSVNSGLAVGRTSRIEHYEVWTLADLPCQALVTAQKTIKVLILLMLIGTLILSLILT